jgi:hypothetical protein
MENIVLTEEGLRKKFTLDDLAKKIKDKIVLVFYKNYDEEISSFMKIFDNINNVIEDLKIEINEGNYEESYFDFEDDIDYFYVKYFKKRRELNVHFYNILREDMEYLTEYKELFPTTV